MRIALLQDEIYLPSFAGGIKANRFLLEELVRRGHHCLALTRALTKSPDGPNDRTDFLAALDSRTGTVRQLEPDVFGYDFRGVQVEALDHAQVKQRRRYLIERIREFSADWVLVADDKRRFLLDSAVTAAGQRALPLLQTIIHLPFGPLAVHPSARQTRLLGQARTLLVISEFLRTYVLHHSRLNAHLLRLPVFGAGPFRDLARFDSGFVTMINPCALKGLPIFLSLARAFPGVRFAAVPTWGASEEVLRDLAALPNVHILEPRDEIEEILVRTRILLVPSLWPETFGYAVGEAMLRGIPVLASDVGGLPEAKLGVDYLLPVRPARWHNGSYRIPTQNIQPWSQALSELLGEAETYRRCSRRSRRAALEFVAGISPSALEELLTDLENNRETPA